MIRHSLVYSIERKRSANFTVQYIFLKAACMSRLRIWPSIPALCVLEHGRGLGGSGTEGDPSSGESTNGSNSESMLQTAAKGVDSQRQRQPPGLQPGSNQNTPSTRTIGETCDLPYTDSWRCDASSGLSDRRASKTFGKDRADTSSLERCGSMPQPPL